MEKVKTHSDSHLSMQRELFVNPSRLFVMYNLYCVLLSALYNTFKRVYMQRVSRVRVVAAWQSVAICNMYTCIHTCIRINRNLLREVRRYLRIGFSFGASFSHKLSLKRTPS